MSNAASHLGNFDQRRSASHAYSTVSPSTVPETQCAEELFQQPPPRPLLPPIYSQGPSLGTDVDPVRHYWQTSHQSVFRHGEHEPSARTEYEFIEGLETVRSIEGSAGTSQILHRALAQRGSAFYPDFKREESELFVPLSRHSRSLSGVLGQPSAAMSSEYLHSSGFQEHPTLAELATEAPIASSSCSSSSSIAKSRNLATGGYSHSSVPDTSTDAADFAQYDGYSLSGGRSASDHGPTQVGGELPDSGGSGSIGPVRSKKQRLTKGRERARIELAPDQPPTTQGKQRERVYVACQQCRSRKIRCDGAKPMCFNCNQRGTGICEFDCVPKRRGPDRQPGARQRHGNHPAPRVRRKPTKSDKHEAPSAPQGTSLYLTPRSGSESAATPSPRTDNRNATWARIPSPPPSSASTSGYEYGYDQPAPGSSGSDASQAPLDYRNLHAPPFAYDTPQDSYFGNTLRPEPDPRVSVPRISTDSLVHPSTAPLSGTFSPETPDPISYPVLTNPFDTQTSSYPIAPSDFVTGASRGSLDSMTTLDSTASPESMGFGDYVPHGLNFVQPVVADHEPVVHNVHTDFDTLAAQQRGNLDYLAVSDVCTLHSRRSSLAHVNPASYNPYQWAVIQGQDICASYISTFEDEEPAVPFEFSISQTPSLDFVRKTWWDSLLDTYCSEPYCTPTIAARYESAYGFSITVPSGTYAAGTVRQQVGQIVMRDLQSLFKDSIVWFAFINVPLFFGTFFRARETMQPALVLSVLMFSNYLRSSAVELGAEGMMRTLWLKEKAQAALDASVNAAWIDPGLAQAAWLLALFEISSQPMRSVTRLHSALATLDGIIRALSLTFIDAQDPSSSVFSDSTSSSLRTSSLSNGNVSHILPMPLYNRQPIADARLKSKNNSQLLQYHSPNPNTAGIHHHAPANAWSASQPATCMCNELSLGQNWAEAKEHVPFWLNSPAWKATWNDGEVRREECRRLCWSTLHLIAGYTTYRTSLGLNTLDLFLLHPSNVHNIFPGENLTDLSTLSPSTAKFETVWALYARATLLWHACLRIRNVSDRERAVFAHSVWLEAEAIENALDGHSCNTERASLYHGREYLFNARMYVSSEFRRFVPHPSPDMSGAVHRRKAEEWLTHQATLAKRSMHGMQMLTGIRGTMLAKRPFFCFWFMGHISRCLQLWQGDKTLTVALELAKHFLSPINYLSALWPCEDQRMQYAGIRQDLENACLEAGLALPPPVDPTFPLPSSLTVLP